LLKVLLINLFFKIKISMKYILILTLFSIVFTQSIHGSTTPTLYDNCTTKVPAVINDLFTFIEDLSLEEFNKTIPDIEKMISDA